ncbi:hypothetical protein IJ818_02960 [bacterium]|nr:hypothetical protein [bacterium]
MKNVLNISLRLFIIFFIIAGALFLRAFYLTDTPGLTINESIVYQGLYNPFELETWKGIFHAEPVFSLYTLITSLWGVILKNSALYLRALSVIFGIITCFIAYFLQERIYGITALLLFSANSFLINYSQEVGMFSLLGLFAVLNVVSLLKIKNSDKGYSLWSLSVLGMTLTDVFTLLFALLEIIFFCLYQRKNKKFFKSIIITAILLVPYFVYVVINYKKYFDYYFGINYDYASVFAFVQNFLTPKLIELNLNNFLNYFYSLYADINFYTLGFIIVPIVVSIYFIFKSFVKHKFNILLFLIGVIYILIRIFLQYSLGLQFTTGEYIVVLPIFLVIMAMGVEKNVLSLSLIFVFLGVNLFYLFIQDNSALKNKRVSVLGVSDIINITVKDRDLIITWMDVTGLDTVIDKKVKIVNIYDEYIKDNEEVFNDKVSLKKMSEKEKKDFLRDYFLNRRYPKNTVFKTNILMGFVQPKGQIYLVYPKKYDYDYDKFLDIISKDYLYYKYTYKDLMTMHTITLLNKMLFDYYYRRDEKDNFIINIYKK